METEQLIQGSDSWLQARCGSIGSTRVSAILSSGKGGAESTGRINCRAEVVAERLTSCPVVTFKNAYMERGNEDEESARDSYSFLTGKEVVQVGLIQHPTIDHAHSSPDGLLGSDGVLELKRKIPALHIDYILKNRVPPEYVKQLLWHLACSGRSYAEFVSYCPEMPEEMQLFICRLERDEAAIKEMEAAVIAFNESVEEVIRKLKELRG